MGVRQHEKNFDLPEEEPGAWWWSQDDWEYEDEGEQERPEGDGSCLEGSPRRTRIAPS